MGRYTGTPILGVRYEESAVSVHVDPDIMANPLSLARLEWTLANMFNAEEVRRRPLSGSYDLKLEFERGTYSWTAEQLSDAVVALSDAGCWVRTVRLSQKRDMVVNVVIEPEVDSADVIVGRQLVGYHVAALINGLSGYGVVHAEIAQEPIYDNLVVRLFVPEIGVGIALDELARQVRRIMSSELVATEAS